MRRAVTTALVALPILLAAPAARADIFSPGELARPHAALEGLSRTLASFDSTLDAALSKSRSKIGHQLTKMERKVHREAVRRDQRASDDASYVMSMLYPEKHLQERLYSIVPFLARHGLDLVDHIYESIDESCPDHRLLIV